jgi:hypothetical protein
VKVRGGKGVLTGMPFLFQARQVAGGWPIFNVSCPHIGERGCPSFAGFAKLGTTDPGLAGGFTRSSRPSAPPSGG